MLLACFFSRSKNPNIFIISKRCRTRHRSDQFQWSSIQQDVLMSHHPAGLNRQSQPKPGGNLMYSILVRLMDVAALTQLSISLTNASDCKSGACLKRIEKASREVLHVDWKPISIFPAEARRF